MSNTTRRILIFTDCCDIAQNELYVSLDKTLREAKQNNYVIDPIISITKFSIINASFLIRLMAEYYGKDDLFLVVMNALPTQPERLFGKTKSGIKFVGNNSGYFNWLFQDHGLQDLYINHITRSIDGRSFGGRNVQIPTACRLLCGEIYENIGSRNMKLSNDFYIPNNTIVHTDNFGLMKIKTDQSINFLEGTPIRIFINGEQKVTGIFTHSLKEHAQGIWVLFQGSSLGGMLEIGQVQNPNSSQSLGAKVGDTVYWEKIS